MKAIISFKTKIKQYANKIGNEVTLGGEYFAMKKGLSRHDVENVRELSGHWGINSSLMPQIITRGVLKALDKQNLPDYITISENIPSCISIERGFLSTIRIVIDI